MMRLLAVVLCAGYLVDHVSHGGVVSGFDAEEEEDGIFPTETGKHRHRRNILVFPSGSIIQLSVGMATSLDLTDEHSGLLGFGFQQNVQLPTNLTQLLYPHTRVKRDFFVYDHLQDWFRRAGLNGTECLKKTICQLAETPLEGGLLEEIFNFIFTPSNHEGMILWSDETYDSDSFLMAENAGRRLEDCHAIFPECPRSPLDLISLLETETGPQNSTL